MSLPVLDPNTPIPALVTATEFNYILAALSVRPYNEVNDLIAKLLVQGQAVVNGNSEAPGAVEGAPGDTGLAVAP
jgi:hypothetical protein